MCVVCEPCLSGLGFCERRGKICSFIPGSSGEKLVRLFFLGIEHREYKVFS